MVQHRIFRDFAVSLGPRFLLAPRLGISLLFGLVCTSFFVPSFDSKCKRLGLLKLWFPVAGIAKHFLAEVVFMDIGIAFFRFLAALGPDVHLHAAAPPPL